MAAGVVLIGALLVGVVVKDVIHELFHPAGAGALSGIMRSAVWRLFHGYARGEPKRLRLAGPVILVATMFTWVLLTALGFALIFLPFMPEHFRYASPLDPSANADFGSAVYLSLVGLATLGFGDITPTTPWLRIAATLEAFLGFMILTAGISWALAIKPVLAERRALASTLHAWLTSADHGHTSLQQLPATDLAPLLLALTAQVGMVRARLLQSPETYYFQVDDQRGSLAAVLHRLLPECHALMTSRAEPGVRFHAAALADGLAQLADLLASEFLHLSGHSPAAVLQAYAADHLRPSE